METKSAGQRTADRGTSTAKGKPTGVPKEVFCMDAYFTYFFRYRYSTPSRYVTDNRDSEDVDGRYLYERLEAVATATEGSRRKQNSKIYEAY